MTRELKVQRVTADLSARPVMRTLVLIYQVEASILAIGGDPMLDTVGVGDLSGQFDPFCSTRKSLGLYRKSALKCAFGYCPEEPIGIGDQYLG
ncbi:hypothetical protein CH337_18980 [Rhodoblastus acidophilus]|nr:hypothetical protein CKO16_21055 [Rhodoblastus acidophilus]RAI16911.1 hypothetical protein CH337_18980 [Rhodoblastus acidophilus]